MNEHDRTLFYATTFRTIATALEQPNPSQFLRGMADILTKEAHDPEREKRADALRRAAEGKPERPITSGKKVS